MPRVSREQADLNRAAITDVSSRLFRERGIDGVSVSDLMAAAGLTHGGFYGHFESKNALAAEVCAQTFAHSAERWQKRIAGQAPEAARTALIEAYLSRQSRNAPGKSCAATALAIDVAREPVDAPVRAAYASGVEKLVAILATLQDTGDADADRRAALADFATMVGAMVLARATLGQAASDEFLNAGRERLAGMI